MAKFARTRTVLHLAFSHVHQWLPPPPNFVGGEYASLPSYLEKAGIKKVALLRHGNAEPSPNGVEFDRVLSEVGRSQAREAGSSFGKELRPFYPELLVSPAPRTVETAKLFLEQSGVHMTTPKEGNPVLYDGTMQPLGSQLFRKIGYAPLRDYLENDDEDDRKAAQNVLGEYSHNVIQLVCDSIRNPNVTSPTQTDMTLLVVGHAIYLPAVALGLASLLGCDKSSQDVVLSTNTKEAEGYVIETTPPGVELLVRPTNVKQQ